MGNYIGIVLFLISIVIVYSAKNVYADDNELNAEKNSYVGDLGDAIEIEGTPFNINYFGIVNGPAISGPTSFQPDLSGNPDRNRPVLLRNFLGLGYNVNTDINVSANIYWSVQPFLNRQIQLLDPFLKVTHNSLFNYNNFNLYGDFRLHFPSSFVSRQTDLRGGLQAIQAVTYAFEGTHLLLGVVGSVRGNLFGLRGMGSDMELFLSPNMYYQFASTAAFTLLYEMYASHYFGQKPFQFNNEGTNLEPGVSWDVSPQFNFNPFLNIPPSGNILRSASFGMMLHWRLL